MMRVQKLIEQSAASDLPVLVTGEVGVGKDRVAREIHRRSSRAGNPLVEVHCVSLPSDFFSRPLPRHGSLLLHDIGELSCALQDSLLALLKAEEERAFDAVDQDPVDIRVLATTHRELTQAMQTGAFSEELYYRVNLIHIHVPPLCAHREDLPALFHRFMQEHAPRDGFQGELPEALVRTCQSVERKPAFGQAPPLSVAI